LLICFAAKVIKSGEPSKYRQMFYFRNNRKIVILTIRATSPDDRDIRKIVAILQGGVVIIPTDTIYAMVCDIYSHKAIDRVCKIKNVKLEKSNFSFLFDSLSNISRYTRAFDRSIYKLLNRALPGPYTFILEAGSEVPSIFRAKKKTIGIRIPDHAIVQKIIEVLGNPLMSTSLHNDDEITEYPVDPNEIYDLYGSEVDCVVDGGYGHLIGSTIVDCTLRTPEILRQGAGDASILA
jgi:tRNA threonylcarbamoyl adenosine modification protein (Sua5/YciO/YrdC/YwlC family)